MTTTTDETAHDHLRARAEKAEAEAREYYASLVDVSDQLTVALAERDAAVARNIILHRQMTEQAADDAKDRIPVADWCFRFFAIFDEAIERIGRSRGRDEWSANLLEDVRTRIADLPGWNGSEGCLPSAFMMRGEHERVMSNLRTAATKCLATHEDIGCSCDGCAALRREMML